ncbi:MAG TPA: hypothetical protein VLE74_01175 [Candidatus Saccharimonadales bacterium]|nr:hypothetical protein [Candidatus Saccharimonadales bacterium]
MVVSAQHVFERLASQNELDQISRALERAGYDYDIHDLDALVDLYTTPKDLSWSEAGRLRYCRNSLGQRAGILGKALEIEQGITPEYYGIDLRESCFSILEQCGVCLDNRGNL